MFIICVLFYYLVKKIYSKPGKYLLKSKQIKKKGWILLCSEHNVRFKNKPFHCVSIYDYNTCSKRCYSFLTIKESSFKCYLKILYSSKDAFTFLHEFNLGQNAFQTATNIKRTWTVPDLAKINGNVFISHIKIFT